MKKYIIIIGIIILTGLIIYMYTFYIWKGTYLNNAGNYINFNIVKNELYVTSSYGGSAVGVSYIDYSIDENYNINISIYTKFFKFLKNPKNKIYIKLSKFGKYKIFYKNPDGTKIFIKEIEYK